MQRYVWFSVAASVAILLWIFSIADPCLIGFLPAGPGWNPIALTRCGLEPASGLIILTNGDLIIRLAGLFVIVGIAAVIIALIDPARVRRNTIGVMLVGLAVGGAIYLSLRCLVYGFTPNDVGFFIAAAVVSAVVTSVAATIGAALAESTWRDDRY